MSTVGPLVNRSRITLLGAFTLASILLLLLFTNTSSSSFRIVNFSTPTGLIPDCPNPRTQSNLRSTPSSAPSCITYTNHTHPFTIIACPSAERCNALTLHILKSSCRVPGRRLSSDEALESRLIGLGEDAFALRVRGAEKRSITQGVWNKGEGEGCSWTFEVVLRNAGRAELDVRWAHENFKALDEMDTEWPPQLGDHCCGIPLLAEPLVFPACPQECPTYLAPPILLPGQFITPSKDLSLSPPSSVPSCDGRTHLPISGSYLPTIEHNPYVVGAHRRFSGTSRFVPHNCVWRHRGIKYADHSPCFSQKKNQYLFMGDSHGRVTYDAVVHRLSGTREVMTRSAKSGDKNATVNNSIFSFHWDPASNELLQNPNPCSHFAQYSSLLLSIGSHNSHSSLSEFADYLRQVFSVFEACDSPDFPILILLLPPTPPPRIDKYVQAVKDRRTYLRMQEYSRLMSEAALAGRGERSGTRWKIVDFNVLTLGFETDLMEPGMDEAHYLETDSLEAAVDEVIGKMEICDSEEAGQLAGEGVQLRKMQFE